MKFPSRDVVKFIRKEYPKGTVQGVIISDGAEYERQ